ncbi:MAG TPA: cyclic nucleotide-binding domain-containing protein [Gaiellaceae bacterium]
MRRRKASSKIDILNRVPLFAGVSKRGMNEIAKIADEIDLPAGKELIREGDPGRQFFVLLDGEAEVRRRGSKVNTLGGGDFFGEIALVTERPTTASVTLTEPSSALVISRPAFRRLLLAEPGIQLQVLEALADRVLD